METALAYIQNHPNCGLTLVEGIQFDLEEQFEGDRIAGRKGEIQLLYFVNGVIDEVLSSGQYMAWYDEYEQLAAELEAEKNRYLQILGVLDRKKTSNMTGTTIKPEQFYTHVRAMFSELFTLGNKVVQFRDQIVDNYLSSRQFCAVSKDVLRIADPVLPLKRLALGILVLWFTLNLGWIFFKFCTRPKAA